MHLSIIQYVVGITNKRNNAVFSDEILHEYKVIVSYIIKIHLMHKTTIIIKLVRHLKNPFPFHLQDDLYL